MSGSLVGLLRLSQTDNQPVRYVNINSESCILGSADNTSIFRLTLADPIQCGPNETIWVGLGDSTFQSSIYTVITGVNDTIYTGGVATAPLVNPRTIAEGYYSADDLATALTAAVNAEVAGATCTYNQLLNKFEFTAPAGPGFRVGGNINGNSMTLLAQIGIIRQTGDSFYQDSDAYVTVAGATTVACPNQVNLQYQRLNLYIRLNLVRSMESVDGQAEYSNLFDKVPLSQSGALAYTSNYLANFQQVQTKIISDISGIITNKVGQIWPSNFPFSMTLLFFICENLRDEN